MSDRILDATDIGSNTARFCEDCRKMFTETRKKSSKYLGISLDLYSKRGLFRGKILAKGWGFKHRLLRFKQNDPPTCELCIFLRVELGHGPDQQLPTWFGTFHGFALPGEPAAEFVDVLQPPFDPTSDVVFDAAKEWIGTCRRLHKQCRVTDQAGPPPLPTRLIDVGTRDAPTVRLHVTGSSGMDERGEYACLSYCWGGDQFKTLLGTLDELKRQIPIDRLSLTVADAVEVTRRLGLRYLWVDALCIVQDSDEDKAREIEGMGAIYKNSTVTIAAASAPAASEGFLRRPPPPLRSAAVRVRLPNDEIGIVRLTLSHFYHAGRLALGLPLESRGWCLQEYLLSPRLLVFTLFNVEQVCQSGQGIGAGDGPFGTGGQSYWHISRLPQTLSGEWTPRSQLIKAGICEAWLPRPQDRIKFWQEIVRDFSSRELSDPRDRLPALAGIAGEIQRVWGDEYIFGMWKGLIPWTLAWVAGVPRNGPQRKRLSLAPTWSWASVNTTVQFHSSTTTYRTLIEFTWETGVETDMAASSPPFPRLAVHGTLIRSTEAPEEPLDVWLDLDSGPSDKEEWSYLSRPSRRTWF